MVKILRHIRNRKGNMVVYALALSLLIILSIVGTLNYRGLATVIQGKAVADAETTAVLNALDKEVKELDNLHLREQTIITKVVGDKTYTIEVTPTGNNTYKKKTFKTDFNWLHPVNSYLPSATNDPYSTIASGHIANLIAPRLTGNNLSGSNTTLMAYSSDKVAKDYVSQTTTAFETGIPSSINSLIKNYRYRIDGKEWSALLPYTNTTAAYNHFLTTPDYLGSKHLPYMLVVFEYFNSSGEKLHYTKTPIVNDWSGPYLKPTADLDKYSELTYGYKRANIQPKNTGVKNNRYFHAMTLPNNSGIQINYNYTDSVSGATHTIGGQPFNINSSEISLVTHVSYDRVCLGFKSVSALNSTHWSNTSTANKRDWFKTNAIGMTAWSGSPCQNIYLPHNHGTVALRNKNNNILDYNGDLYSDADMEDTMINGYSNIPKTTIDPIINFLQADNSPGAFYPNLKLQSNLNAYQVLAGADKPSTVSYAFSGNRVRYLNTLISAMGTNTSSYFTASDLTWVKNLANRVESDTNNFTLNWTTANYDGKSEYKSRLYCDDPHASDLNAYMAMIKYIEHRMKWLKTRSDYVAYVTAAYANAVATNTMPTIKTPEQYYKDDGWADKGTTKGINRGPEVAPKLPCISDVNRNTVLTEFKEDELMSLNLAISLVNNIATPVEVKVEYSDDIEGANTDWKMYYVNPEGNALISQKNGLDKANGVSNTVPLKIMSTNGTDNLKVPFVENYPYFDIDKLNSDNEKRAEIKPQYLNLLTSNITIKGIEITYDTLSSAEYEYRILDDMGREYKKSTIKLTK